MWSKFQTKLWAAVGIFLTVTAIAGVLGVRSYIDLTFAKELESQRSALRQAREQFERDSAGAVLRARLATYLEMRAQQDSQVFAAALQAARREVDVAITERRGYSKASRQKILDTLAGLADEFVVPAQYAASVRSMGTALEAPVDQREIETRPLSSDDWTSFGDVCRRAGLRQLENVVQMYAHLQALRASEMQTRVAIVQDHLGDSLGRGRLYEEYEKLIVPAYQKEWAKYNMPFGYRASAGQFGWSTLPALGRNAFRAEEERFRSGGPVF